MAKATLVKFAFLLCFLGIQESFAGMAVLSAKGSDGSEDFCVVHNPSWQDIPTSLDDTPKYKLVEAKPPELCVPAGNQTAEMRGAAVAVERGHCSLYIKGMNALNAEATAIIIISNESLFTPDVKNLSVRMAVISKEDWKTLKDLGSPIEVQLYAPPTAAFDGNLVLLWLLAVMTVAVGAYWAGITSKPDRTRSSRRSVENGGEGEENSKDEQIHFTPLMVVFFVVMIITMLLLLYYFYKYLVYLVIALFCIASCHGLFECLYPVVLWLPLGSCKIPPNPIPLLKKEPQIRVIFLILFCMGVAIWWGIERNASYAWILQDLLGIAFCISLLKAIRLPSLKVCTLLLFLLLIYDIFFVFITPLFAASGKSVMVQVATEFCELPFGVIAKDAWHQDLHGSGGGNKEQLPMTVKIPRLTKSTLSVCERPYSLLGFGDILVPGLYVAFCHSFDVITNTPRKIYYIATTVAYGVGLLITFMALYLMKEGQPALLYLVPCTLLTGYAIGWWRGELKSLWVGPHVYIQETRAASILTRSPMNDEQSDAEEDIFNRTSKQSDPETQRLMGEGSQE